ncbi:DinB family protein [bacterium]|nr:DinB family protein [bacterium]
MITPEYCRKMAAYNAWQNKGLISIVKAMDDDELRADRGAFFGSIWGTLNHLLWGDARWISRFDGGTGYDVTIPESTNLVPTVAEWELARTKLDARITKWASGVHAVDLVGDLTWHAAGTGREFSKPKGLCVMQLFNHQTHHRGQIHAMLTSLGITPQDTDLPFMPEA